MHPPTHQPTHLPTHCRDHGLLRYRRSSRCNRSNGLFRMQLKKMASCRKVLHTKLRAKTTNPRNTSSAEALSDHAEEQLPKTRCLQAPTPMSTPCREEGHDIIDPEVVVHDQSSKQEGDDFHLHSFDIIQQTNPLLAKGHTQISNEPVKMSSMEVFNKPMSPSKCLRRSSI